MIAILLYLIGLISALVTMVAVGFDAPPIYSALLAAYQSGSQDLLPALAVATVGGYGLSVWIFQMIVGPPGPPAAY